MSALSSSRMPESACALATQGVSVHFLRRKSKAPLVKDWPKQPFNTPTSLRATWHPGLNVGIRTGECSKIGGLYLHAIDFDVRVPEKAEEAMCYLKQMLPDVDDFPFVISGSGGANKHIYFLTDRPFPSRKLHNSKERFTDQAGKTHWTWEIDLSGNGRQMVCPPSIHPDTNQEYAWGRKFCVDKIDLDLGIGPIVSVETVESWGVGPLNAETDDDLVTEIRRQPLKLTDEQVNGVLKKLPFAEWCEDRGGWTTVGMALHHQYEGGDRGFALWTIYSKPSTKYNAEDQRRVWASFRGRSNPVTMATLIKAVGGIGTAADVVGEIDGFPLTEDGVALAFAQRFKDDFRYCKMLGCWYKWDGFRWRTEQTDLALEWARRMCREHADAAPNKSPAAKAMSKAAAAAAVERLARADRAFAIEHDVWDRDLWLLGTPGGTVDLHTGVIRPAQPSDMITKLTVIAPIPLESFNPERDCPLWLAFLQQATGGDAAVIRFLQQWAGYSLTGDTREEALLFVHGPGGSGKSTAIDTLADTMGDYAISVPIETLTASKNDRHPTELARLKGPRFARTTETEQGRPWAESRIKSLTGGDVVAARFMNKDFFEFKPTFKLTIVGNHAPHIINLDEAMRRRFNVLPFDHPPTQPDTTLKDALKKEWAGILSWAIVGCLDWQRNDLKRPAALVNATEDYFSKQDIFAHWLEEDCEQGEDYVETSQQLWDSWQCFAARNGEPSGNRTRDFPDRLKAKRFTLIRDSAGIRGRGFKGLRVVQHSSFHDVSGDDLVG